MLLVRIISPSSFLLFIQDFPSFSNTHSGATSSQVFPCSRDEAMQLLHRPWCDSIPSNQMHTHKHASALHLPCTASQHCTTRAPHNECSLRLSYWRSLLGIQ